jgi:hypothetical protein
MVYGFLCGLSTIERLSADFFGLDDGLVNRAKHLLIRSFGLIVTFLCIITTLVVLLNGDGSTTPCPNCTWLSCVPFPPWESASEKWWYCDDCGQVTADIVVEPTLQATVDLSDENSLDRDGIKKNLAAYCRMYCSSDT